MDSSPRSQKQDDCRMDSDLVISMIAKNYYAGRKRVNKKRKQQSAGMDSDLAMISDDDVWKLKEAPSWMIFPCLVVLPDTPSQKEEVVLFVSHDGVVMDTRSSPNKEEVLFISHDGAKQHKKPMPFSNTDLYSPVVNTRDGWILFVLDDGVAMIFNPVTGVQLPPLPSIYTCLDLINYVFLAADTTLVAFAAHHTNDGRLILATAAPGDHAWSRIEFDSKHNFLAITDIVFHHADRKFYAMDRTGKLLAFSLSHKTVGCDHHKTTVVSEYTFRSKGREDTWFDHPHLVSVGGNLLQVTVDFEIFNYCPKEDRWIGMMTNDIDFGNNSLFIDSYGAKLIPLPLLPQGEGEGEQKLRRNCIYFIHYEEIPCPQEAIDRERYEEELKRVEMESQGNIYDPCDRLYDRLYGDGDEEEEIQYLSLSVPHARIYDVSKGIVEPCFSTDIQSHGQGSPPIMWFMPSLFTSPTN